MRHERPSGAGLLYSGALFGVIAYLCSAALFVGFSWIFVSQRGPADYGRFSLLLNTVSALTLLGNYHGSLVSYSVTADRRAYRRFRLPVALYSAAAALFASAILAAIGDVPPLGWLFMTPAFFCLAYSGLPSAVLLSSPAHYLLNVVRAIYQAVLVVAFWPLLATGQDIPSSFAAALFAAAALNLGLLSAFARGRFAWRGGARPAHPHLLIAALAGNLAMMATILLDKFALRFLLPGTEVQRGVYLLYTDLIGRLSAAFNILLPTLTYLLLERLQTGGTLRRPILLAMAGAATVGLIALIGGEILIPLAYRISLASIDSLPMAMACFITLYGVSSVLLAFCNASGRVWYLGAHYAAMFLVTAGVMALFVLALPGGLSVVALAWSVAAGQGTAILSAGLLYFLLKRQRQTETAA